MRALSHQSSTAIAPSSSGAASCAVLRYSVPCNGACWPRMSGLSPLARTSPLGACGWTLPRLSTRGTQIPSTPSGRVAVGLLGPTVASPLLDAPADAALHSILPLSCLMLRGSRPAPPAWYGGLLPLPARFPRVASQVLFPLRPGQIPHSLLPFTAGTRVFTTGTSSPPCGKGFGRGRIFPVRDRPSVAHLSGAE